MCEGACVHLCARVFKLQSTLIELAMQEHVHFSKPAVQCSNSHHPANQRHLTLCLCIFEQTATYAVFGCILLRYAPRDLRTCVRCPQIIHEPPWSMDRPMRMQPAFSTMHGRPLGLRVLCLVEQQETTNVSEMATVDYNMEVGTKRGCILRKVLGENREKCNFHFCCAARSF